jgi:hypothetical protein
VFILNGLGWGSHGPINENTWKKREKQVRNRPLVFTDHEKERLDDLLTEKERKLKV